jgi:hypothetical protein
MNWIEVSIDFSGSEEEEVLSTHIEVDIDDCYTTMGVVKWPFNKNGSAEFDEWFENFNENPKEMGIKLYNCVFNEDVRMNLDSILSKVKGSDTALIKINTLDNPLINRIPFEIFHNNNNFLFSGNRVIIRFVNEKTDIYPKLKNLNRFLVIVAEPICAEYPTWGHDSLVEKLRTILTDWSADFTILEHANQQEVIKTLTSNAHQNKSFDAILVVAHGEAASENADGFLILEDNGQPQKLSGASFAAALPGHQGCFIFLCSCSTSSVVPSNPFASVAHNLIINGQAGSVLAMQRPITINLGVDMIKNFVNLLKNNGTVYDAYRESLISNLNGVEHGVPCFYSRPMKKEKIKDLLAKSEFENELERIKALFSIDPIRSRVALIFAGFVMGVKSENYNQAKNENWFNIPKGQYKYPGLTSALTDFGASKGIIALLGKIFTTDEIDRKVTIDSDENSSSLLADPTYTNFIFFGSKSHSLSRTILTQYSEDFTFEYNKNNWSLTDKRNNIKYKVPDPSQEQNNINNQKDYALIEKMVDAENNKVYFIIAGMWDTSTLAAGKYLLNNVDRLYRKFGNGGFQILLSVNAGHTNVLEVIEERKPLKK